MRRANRACGRISSPKTNWWGWWGVEHERHDSLSYGWLAKVTCEADPRVVVKGLRPQRNERGEEGGPGYGELVVDLACA